MNHKEMLQEANWQKTIPRERDQTQSLILAWIVGLALLGLCLWTWRLASPQAPGYPTFLFESIAVSTAFSLTVWIVKAATPAGAAIGGMICLLITFWTRSAQPSLLHTALAPLAILFVVTFLSTRAGRRRKISTGLAEGPKGRTASQVIANLSVAALCVVPWMSIDDVTMKGMCLAVLVEATADTVSSELGQAFGGAPFMLTSLHRVQPGVDGAITLLGTLSGIAAGAVVVISGVWSMHLRARDAVISLAAGIFGLFFDSLLGATVERRGWLGNDLVNFTSTAAAASVTALVQRAFPL